MHACDTAAKLKLLVQNGDKMARLPRQQGPLLEISYIPLLSVIKPYCHKLYQISSREAEV